MSTLLRVCVAATVMVGFSTSAWGQDGLPFLPSNEQLDDDLDRSLSVEFSSSQDIPDAPDVPRVVTSDDADHDDGRGIKLRLMGAFWRTQFKDVSFSHREGVSGGKRVKLGDPLDSDNGGFDWSTGRQKSVDLLDGADDGLYEISISFGKYVALRAGFQHNKFTYEHTVGQPGKPLQAFTFGETTWGGGSVLDSEFEIYTGDLEVVLRPLNNSWVTLDLTVGVRYTMWKTQFERRSSALATTPDARETDKLEAGVPTVGIGLTVRPIKQLEFFARARVGALSYERDASVRWDSSQGRWENIDRLEREAQMVELDAGVSLVLGDTVGLIAGYRFSSYDLERITDNRSLRYEGSVGGFYAGAMLQF